jgi:short-subunit dehydrogenase
VQNAAVGKPFPLGKLPLDHWQYALEVNLTAPLFLTQALMPQLEKGAGRVLHLGTGVAHNPQQGTAVYGITKSAFYRLWQQLNADLVAMNSSIAVGSLSPGVVDTSGVREHIEEAREHSLPHVAFFEQTYKDGSLSDPTALASFCMSLLFDVPTDMFREQEWAFRNPEHRALIAAASSTVDTGSRL